MQNNVFNKKNVKQVVSPFVLVILLGFIGYKVWDSFTHEDTDNAQIEMRLVPVLARVAGYVEKINADDYSQVKKGQLLMVIDTTELCLQLKEMEADHAQALADVENAKASLVNAEAAVISAKNNSGVSAIRKEKANNDLMRDTELFQSNAITKKQYDDSRSNYDISSKQNETGFSDVRVAETRIGILRAQLSKAEALAQLKENRISQQKLKISYCYIYAPSDGNIGKRNVDPGQYVQPGAPLFTEVNNKSLWVVANFKESQIKSVYPGKAAEIKVDGYSDLDLKGRIVSVSGATGARFSLLPPDNATGNFIKVTQRIPVKIEIENAYKYKSILRAGMSVEVSVSAD